METLKGFTQRRLLNYLACPPQLFSLPPTNPMFGNLTQIDDGDNSLHVNRLRTKEKNLTMNK